MMDYHSLDCCDSNRGIDKLLNNYKKSIDLVYNLIINNPDKLIEILWKQESPLSIDMSCRCSMGSGDRRSAFSCSQCKNIGKIKDFRKSDLIFEIQCGVNKGKRLIILPYHISNLFICYDDEISEKYKSYLLQNCNCAGTVDSTVRFIRSDPFTNRALIMSVITKIFRDKKLPHSMNLHTAFICGNKGYSILDDPTIGSLDDLHKITEYHTKEEDMCSPFLHKISRSIIMQLIVILNELSYFNFSHGNPSVESLVFGYEHVSYKYEGIKISGDITLKIINFWKSSATFSKIRYFPDDVKSKLFLECNVLIPKIHIMMINNTEYYKIGKCNIDTLISMNNSGIPIFTGSFDLYCFFVSLMCDQSFYMSVIREDDLYSIWKSIWLEEDLDKIDELICQNHLSNLNNFETVINIISEFWLRCDIIKYLLSLIKKL